MTGRNILLALVLSLILTLVSGIIYFFYPLIIAIIGNRQGAGIGAATGGAGIFLLLAVELALFVVIFAVLQWMSKKG